MDVNINIAVTLNETKELQTTMEKFCDALKGMGIAIAVSNQVQAATGINPEISAAPQAAQVAAPVSPVPVQAAIPAVPATPMQSFAAPVAPVQAAIPVAATPAATLTAAPVMTPPAPAAVPTATAQQYTLEQIQNACAPLADAGKLAALGTLVQEFGVPSMQQIPVERYGELVIKLRALGARL